jgi:DNA invertase Pin-like site-specific DNA recombinase
MAIAKAKGKLKGRAPKLSAARQAHLLKLHTAGEHTIAELCEVSGPTVYRVLERAQAASAPPREHAAPPVNVNPG